MIKKLGILLLIVACLSQYQVILAEDEIQKPTVNFAEEMNLLENLGFIDDNFAKDFSKEMTVAEFSKLILQYTGNLTDSRLSSEQLVKMAENMHYLQDYNGTKYGINTPVTMVQTAAGIMTALGYGAYCENNGGYPDGYVIAATQNKIFSGIEFLNEKIPAFEEIAKMLYNALDAQYMKLSSIGETSQYYAANKRTILTEVHHIYKDSGKITATGVTSLYSKKGNTGKDEITINQTNYIINDETIINHLGKKITYYYLNNSTDDLKILAYKIDKENLMLNISAAQLDKKATEFTEKKIAYLDENEKKKIAKISDDAAILYNGVAYPEFTKETFKVDNGNIELIDANSDSIYETVKIWEYIDYRVYNYDLDKYEMTDVCGTIVEIDPSDSGKIIEVFDNENNPVFAIDIKFDKIASIAESMDKSYMKIIITNNKISGKIQSVRDDGSDKMLTIGGTEYKINKSYYSLRPRFRYDLKSGFEGNFYLNQFGDIVSILKLDSSSLHTGYAVEVRKVIDGVNPQCYLKLYTTEDRMEVYAFADKMLIDNQEKKIDAIDVYTKFMTKTTIPVTNKQLILYKLNAQNEITYIDFADPLKDTSNDNRQESLRLFFSKTEAKDMFYRSPSVNFKSRVHINDKVKVFKVGPLDKNNIPIDINDDDYSCKGMSAFKDEETYVIDAYTTSTESFMCTYIVLYPGSTDEALAKPSDFLVVGKMYQALDSEENLCDVIEGYLGDSAVKYMIKPNSGADRYFKSHKLQVGDSLRLGTDDKNRLVALELVYSKEQNKFMYVSNPTTDISGEFPILYGVPIRERDGIYEVRVGSDPENKDSKIYYFRPSGFRLATFDKEEPKNKVYKGSPSDIKTYEEYPEGYSTILLCQFWGISRAMVIYK